MGYHTTSQIKDDSKAMLSSRTHLKVPLPELLNEGGVLHSLSAFSGDVVDAGLALLHAGHVVLQAGHLLTRLCAVIPTDTMQL